MKAPRFDILAIKHWQLILLFVALLIPLDTALTYAAFFWPGLWWLEGFATMSLYVAYPVLTWKRLDELLAGQTLFESANPRKVIASAVAVVIMFICAPLAAVLPPHGPVNIALSVALLFCLSFICAVPGKQLKSIELKRNAGIWEYVPEAFQFFMWPLGVFWLQPRINRVLERNIIIKE